MAKQHGVTVEQYLYEAAEIRAGRDSNMATILTPEINKISEEVLKAESGGGGNPHPYRVKAWAAVDRFGKYPKATASTAKYQASVYSMLPVSQNIASGNGAVLSTLHNEIAQGKNGFEAFVAEQITSQKPEIQMNLFMGAPGSIMSVPSNGRTEHVSYTSQNDSFKSTPMMLLVRTLQSQKLVELLTKAQDAASKGWFDLCNLKLSLRDNDGRTVLHYAYALGQTKLVTKILEIERSLPDVDKPSRVMDKFGQTPQALLLSMTPQKAREILIKLEMHPDKNFGHAFNFIGFNSSSSDATINVNGTKFLLLNNRDFLVGLTQCSDYKSKVSKDMQSIIATSIAAAKSIGSDGAGNPKYQTIGERCYKGVKDLQSELLKQREESIPAADIVNRTKAATKLQALARSRLVGNLIIKDHGEGQKDTPGRKVADAIRSRREMASAHNLVG